MAQFLGIALAIGYFSTIFSAENDPLAVEICKFYVQNPAQINTWHLPKSVNYFSDGKTIFNPSNESNIFLIKKLPPDLFLAQYANHFTSQIFKDQTIKHYTSKAFKEFFLYQQPYAAVPWDLWANQMVKNHYRPQYWFKKHGGLTQALLIPEEGSIKYFDVTYSGGSFKPDDLARLVDSKNQNKFINLGILSTSKYEKIAEKFAKPKDNPDIEPAEKSEPVILMIKGHSGSDIEEISSFRREAEVTYPSGALFSVKNILHLESTTSPSISKKIELIEYGEDFTFTHFASRHQVDNFNIEAKFKMIFLSAIDRIEKPTKKITREILLDIIYESYEKIELAATSIKRTRAKKQNNELLYRKDLFIRESFGAKKFANLAEHPYLIFSSSAPKLDLNATGEIDKIDAEFFLINNESIDGILSSMIIRTVDLLLKIKNKKNNDHIKNSFYEKAALIAEFNYFFSHLLPYKSDLENQTIQREFTRLLAIILELPSDKLDMGNTFGSSLIDIYYLVLEKIRDTP